MSSKTMKLVTVPANGQISIGKAWAGRQILIEERSAAEIRISAGTFVPENDKIKNEDDSKKSNSKPSSSNPLFSKMKKEAKKEGKSR